MKKPTEWTLSPREQLNIPPLGDKYDLFRVVQDAEECLTAGDIYNSVLDETDDWEIATVKASFILFSIELHNAKMWPWLGNSYAICLSNMQDEDLRKIKRKVDNYEKQIKYK